MALHPFPPQAASDGLPPPLIVRAAGSLKAALQALAADFATHLPDAPPLDLGFGASGLLKDRLLAGEPAEVFASANLAHPQALHAAGRAGPVRCFCANALCALVASGVAVSSEDLPERLLDPALRVGISTPGADPSGDYAWALFDRIETLPGHAGSAARLKAKALQLTGSPAHPRPPAGCNVYGALVAGGQADLFLTYRSNARLAQAEQPQLRLVELPSALLARADYGVVLLHGARPAAARFVDHLCGPVGQAVLRGLGFLPPGADPQVEGVQAPHRPDPPERLPPQPASVRGAPP